MLITGIVHVTGEHDVGKTTFALESGAEPGKILFIDDDVKGRSTIEAFAGSGIDYVDLVALNEKRTEYDFHKAVVEQLKEIPEGRYDCIVWDTWTNFAATCHPYVLRHASQFRDSWSPMGTIKGAQQWVEARRYESTLISMLARKASSVVLITHLKDHYQGKVKVPGKQVPAASPVLQRIARFRIWLRQNPNGRPVPIGLVLKRLDKKEYVAGSGIRTVSVLPRKIVPREDEHSLWDSITRYWKEPFGDREPTPEELPDEFELSILDSTLTRDQRHTFNALVESGLLQDEEEVSLTAPAGDDEEEEDENAVRVRELSAEGKKAPAIAKELGIALPEVLKVLER